MITVRRMAKTITVTPFNTPLPPFWRPSWSRHLIRWCSCKGSIPKIPQKSTDVILSKHLSHLTVWQCEHLQLSCSSSHTQSRLLCYGNVAPEKKQTSGQEEEDDADHYNHSAQTWVLTTLNLKLLLCLCAVAQWEEASTLPADKTQTGKDVRCDWGWHLPPLPAS